MDNVKLTKSDGTVVEFKAIGTNAICDLEDRLGLTFGEIMTAIGVTGLDRWSLRVTREFLLACQVPGKSGAEPSLLDIGDLIDYVGFEGIGAAVNGLILPARQREGDIPPRPSFPPNIVIREGEVPVGARG